MKAAMVSKVLWPVAALGVVVAGSGAAMGMVPNVARLAAEAAEDAGCAVASIEDLGLKDGSLAFAVTCTPESTKSVSEVLCKDGVCAVVPPVEQAERE